MAGYQDFAVQVTNSTSLLGEPSDGRQYFIVGASNAHSSKTEAKGVSSATLFEIPPNTTLTIPGAGFPTKDLRSNHGSSWIFYYVA